MSPRQRKVVKRAARLLNLLACMADRGALTGEADALLAVQLDETSNQLGELLQ